MCITPTKKYKVPKTFKKNKTGYKVVTTNHKVVSSFKRVSFWGKESYEEKTTDVPVFRPVIMSGSYNRDDWNVAEHRPKNHDAGYHIFKTKDEAYQYMNGSNRSVYEVEYNDIITTGTTDGYISGSQRKLSTDVALRMKFIRKV